MLKKGAKVIVEGLLTATNPEVGAVQYAVGQLTELVIDKAVDRFTQEDVWEQYEQGKWIYIDRGKEHNKLRSAIEMAAETSMFQDSDEILQQDEARQLFSPRVLCVPREPNRRAHRVRLRHRGLYHCRQDQNQARRPGG